MFNVERIMIGFISRPRILREMKKVKQDVSQSTYVPIHLGKEAIAFSKETGLWLLANVDQSIGWPQKKVMVIYQSRKVLLLPASKTVHAAAAVITKAHTLKEGKIFLMQFLSALAYAEQGKIDIVQWTNSSTQGALTKHLRLPLAKQRGMTSLFFRPTELPNPGDPKARQALAFFREGLSLNHAGYSFLSYYKIINMKYPDGSKQKKWIRQNIPALENLHHLKTRMNDLKQKHSDPAAYIYHECRCAVAHASMEETTFDPESIEDEIRFYEMRPIAHALAKLIIEKEFGVKAKFTILGEHLYELEGFHSLIGEKISAQLKVGQTLPFSDIHLNTKISLRVWNKRKFRAFENLTPTVVNNANGVVILNLTRDGRVFIPLALDFPNERLLFEPMTGSAFSDDGSKNAASQFADAYRFYGEMIANGVLEVWDATNNKVLGRLLEYLPVNIMPEQTRQNLIGLEKTWRAEAKNRIK